MKLDTLRGHRQTRGEMSARHDMAMLSGPATMVAGLVTLIILPL
jgi:hypothetical protein